MWFNIPSVRYRTLKHQQAAEMHSLSGSETKQERLGTVNRGRVSGAREFRGLSPAPTAQITSKLGGDKTEPYSFSVTSAGLEIDNDSQRQRFHEVVVRFALSASVYPRSPFASALMKHLVFSAEFSGGWCRKRPKSPFTAKPKVSWLDSTAAHGYDFVRLEKVLR
jgi:hypothetical protein